MVTPQELEQLAATLLKKVLEDTMHGDRRDVYDNSTVLREARKAWQAAYFIANPVAWPAPVPPPPITPIVAHDEEDKS